MRTAVQLLDAIDLQRLGMLLLAAADLSKDKYVLLRYSASRQEWRVNVRLLHPALCQCATPLGCVGVGEHIAASKDSPALALDRAVQWLRAGRAALGEIHDSALALKEVS
jgi:hypothetical protein